MAKRKPAAKKVAKNPAGRQVAKPRATPRGRPRAQQRRRSRETGFPSPARSWPSGEPTYSLVVLDPPPEAGEAIAALMAYHGPRVEAWRKAHPGPSWIRWCPQTFPDGCGMTRSGYPTASLAAINPSPKDCELVADAMRRGAHWKAQAAAEVESLAGNPTQFRRGLHDDAAAALRFEIEAFAIEAVKPGIHATLASPEDREVLDKIVAAAVAGFEFAITRYADALQHVPELQQRLAQVAQARRSGAAKSIKQQQERSLERAAQAEELYATGTMTYAQIAERLGVSEKTVSRYLNG